MNQQKIKILYLIDTLEMGGAEKSLVEITGRFKRTIPIFIHIYQGDSLKPNLVQNGIEVRSLSITEQYGYDKALKSLIPMVKDVQPDIIHASLTRSVLISRKLKKEFKDIPLVNSFTSNSYVHTRYKDLNLVRKWKLKYIQWKDRRSAKLADLFISNSHEIKKNNIFALDIPPEKIKVIPRGRDIKELDPAKYSSSQLRKRMGLGNKKIVLNVGRLIRTKGQLDLIKAFAQIAETIPDSILLIAGEGPFRPALEEEIEKFHLENRVKLLGNRNDVPELLAMADVFVFPTYLEGLPGSLIEAMLAKNVIICSNIPENKECLPESGGKFFTPGDINSLSLLLKSALRSEDFQLMRNSAYQHACQNFDLDKISHLYEQTYFNLLEERL